ncbi:hypothetical protein NMY22_g9511 [Coprinellus aureogranulatus]|nr:hypothetical protein NMY22_g9511 [Coprinellus aureogranulatus]
MPLQSPDIMETFSGEVQLDALEWTREPHEPISGRSLGQAIEDMSDAGNHRVSLLTRTDAAKSEQATSDFGGEPSESNGTEYISNNDSKASSRVGSEVRESVPYPCNHEGAQLARPSHDESDGAIVHSTPLQPPPSPSPTHGSDFHPPEHGQGERRSSTTESRQGRTTDTEDARGNHTPAELPFPTVNAQTSTPSRVALVGTTTAPEPTTQGAPSANVQAEPTEDVFNPFPVLIFAAWTFLKLFTCGAWPLLQFIYHQWIPDTFADLCESCTRGWNWCLRRRSAMFQSRRPSREVTPVPAKERTPVPERPPLIPTVRCNKCFSDSAPRSIIRCPSRHPICLDCLSSQVVEQVEKGNPDVVCPHVSGCGRPYEEAELQTLPHNVLKQLLDLIHIPERSAPSTQPETAPSEAVVDEDDEEEQQQSTPVGAGTDQATDLGQRIADAISRCRVALGKRRESSLQSDIRSRSPSGTLCDVAFSILASLLTSLVVVKDEPLEALLPPSPVRDEGSDDDVGFYAQSVSALTRLRGGQSRSVTPAGPSYHHEEAASDTDTSFHAQRTRFATAPPFLHSEEQAGPSTLRSMSVQPGAGDGGLFTRLQKATRTAKNAQDRLRRARAAYEHNPCARTQEKLALEERAREDARIEVERLRALMR